MTECPTLTKRRFAIPSGASGDHPGSTDIHQQVEWFVGSRNYPLDTQDGSYSTRVPGLLNHWCPGTVLPLTSDVTAVNTAIDGMSAYGQTYIPSGLVWGWRVLSPGAPFNESKKATDPKVSQVLILMTDGANTKSARISMPHRRASKYIRSPLRLPIRRSRASCKVVRLAPIAFSMPPIAPSFQPHSRRSLQAWGSCGWKNNWGTAI